MLGAFNQEKALVGAFSVIVQPVVELMDSFTALNVIPSYPPSLQGAIFVKLTVGGKVKVLFRICPATWEQ